MSEDHELPGRGTPLSWSAFAIGWAVIAFGVWTMFEDAGSNNPTYSLALALGFNVVNDAVVVPLACLVGYLVSRVVPRRVRPQLCWGLFASAIVVGIGYAPLRGFGRIPDNPSVQPLNYATSISTVLVVVWLIVAVLVIVPAVRRRRRDASIRQAAVSRKVIDRPQ